MSGLHESLRPGAGYLSVRNLLVGLSLFFVLMLAGLPATRAQAALAAFVVAAALCAWVMSRNSLVGIEVERRHRPRVFQNDYVPVTLRVEQTGGLAQTLVLVEDSFFASLDLHQRHLIPMMSPRWAAHLHYERLAERHRGVYLLGPVRLWAADPLGAFFRSVEIPHITRLTVYPHAVDFGGYRLLGPEPPGGPSMDELMRTGQAEEIIGVRPWRPGDPANRIHWRTSMRRGELYTIELNAQAQAEAALFIDLTRRSRFGTGAEATTEAAVGCAASILTEAAERRHRLSMTLVRETVEAFPAGVGLRHLHLLLDRLAVVEATGELEFWSEAGQAAATLRRGSRAIFIATAATTPSEPACDLVRGLHLRGVAVDVVLIDEAEMIRIYRDQEPGRGGVKRDVERLREELGQAGARVLLLTRGQTPADLMPRAAAEPDPTEKTALRE